MGGGTWMYMQQLGPEATIHDVVRGETLGKIAERYDVTVEQLREWNELRGDLIEVGQQIRVLTDAAGEIAEKVPKPKRANMKRRERAPASPSAHGLRLPPREPCKTGPSVDGLGEEAMAASEGLTRDQIRGPVHAMLDPIAGCVAGAPPTGRILTSITVACTGRVSKVIVDDDAGWPPELVACVRDVLRYADFPAHDLPDGETFTQDFGF